MSFRLAFSWFVVCFLFLTVPASAVNVIIQGDLGTPLSPFVPYPEKNLKPGWTLITPPDDEDYFEYKDDHPGGVLVSDIAGTGIDMHFDVGNHTTLSGRDRAAEYPDAEPLAIDYFFGDDTPTVEDGMFFVTIKNLAAGKYAFKSYHNNPAGAGPDGHLGSVALIARAVVSGAVSAWTPDYDIRSTGTFFDSEVGTGLVTFTATGAGDVVITYIGSDEPGYTGSPALNAFELFELTDIAAGIKWTGAGVDDSWCTAQNWEGGIIPGAADAALIESPPQRGPVIDCNLHVGALYGPAWQSDQNQVMDITAGDVVFDAWPEDLFGAATATVNISGSPQITFGSDWLLKARGKSVVNITGEPAITVQGDWHGAAESAGRVEVYVHSGTVNVTDALRIGGAGGGIIDLSGGGVTCGSVELTAQTAVGSILQVGGSAELFVNSSIALNTDGHGNAQMNMLGGTVNTADLKIGAASGVAGLDMQGGILVVRDNFAVPDSCQAEANVNLDGGTIRCRAFAMAAGGAMNITAGTLIIDGYELPRVWQYVDDGYLTAYGSARGLIVDYDHINPGKTTVTATTDLDPDQAWGPRPPDGAIQVPVDVVLNWSSGDSVGRFGRHFIYFGSDRSALENATEASPEFRGSNRGTTTQWDVGSLELWKTFYWRIDEFNTNATTTKGKVWSFTTGCEPIPGDRNRDCVINFKDFAGLAEHWQEKSFWP